MIDHVVTTAIYDALKVLVLTPHIRAYLEANDLKALTQAETALVIADSPWAFVDENGDTVVFGKENC
tara:strand:- start:239 stop:439 length:201 start_codon:yes stop_codon:yes gene_type:complete